MYLFFDTETSDLPRRWNAPETDTDNWPRLVQLAWACADRTGNVTGQEVHLIRPDGFLIAAGAFEQHGISTEYAIAHGVELLPVLRQFLDAVKAADVVVAHNIQFDLNILGAELVRAALDNPLKKRQQRCTMRESTEYCRIPSRWGYKWPTLSELHARLFRETFDNAHDASADCLACMRCYFRLRELKVMR